ncbi:MAG: metallophosphoesterase [bacterium]|nr:metallophosphoesterase [bacterium]
MRLTWLTDIHLNFLSDAALASFYSTLTENRPDALVITGDIGEADSLESYLRALAAHLQCPIYFVLGNHDFYRGSIGAVREQMRHLNQENSRLTYLTQSGIIPLSDSTCLIGHDGWPDGRNGDYERSPVLLNDFLLIRDFRRPDQTIPRLDPEVRRHWLTVMQRLSAEATNYLETQVAEALPNFSHLLIATHVPPFREASLYSGHISGDNYQPFFSSRKMGEMLLRTAIASPQTRITVLCGHSHWTASFSPAPNLTVHTGGAEYGEPVIQRIWNL